MNGAARFAGLFGVTLLVYVANAERAFADDFWSRAAERDHGASRRAERAATRMLEGRGDDSDSHRVRLALIESTRGPGLSDRALVAVSRVALELGVMSGVERRTRLERIAWANDIGPWTAAAARILGTVEWQRGASLEASRYWLRALELSFEPGERAELSVRLGFALRRTGDHGAARRHFSRTLVLDDPAVARREVEAALLGLAVLSLDVGDVGNARRLAERSHAVRSARANVSGITLTEVYALGPDESRELERALALVQSESQSVEGDPQ